MTEQPPEVPSEAPKTHDPADVHALLRNLRDMFDDQQPEASVEPRQRRPVDVEAALRALGITPPEYGLSDDEHAGLRRGEDRLRTDMSERARLYLGVVLGEDAPDPLSVVAERNYERHPGTDVVIPPKKDEAVPSEARRKGGRHAKKRNFRRRFVLGATALATSAAALFGLTTSGGPGIDAAPAPRQTYDMPAHPIAPDETEHSTRAVHISEDTGDIIMTVQSDTTRTVTVKMGTHNAGGPWAMTAEALRAGGYQQPTNEAIAVANPWMKTRSLQAEARSLQPGTTVQYRFENGHLTSVHNAS